MPCSPPRWAGDQYLLGRRDVSKSEFLDAVETAFRPALTLLRPLEDSEIETLVGSIRLGGDLLLMEGEASFRIDLADSKKTVIRRLVSKPRPWPMWYGGEGLSYEITELYRSVSRNPDLRKTALGTLWRPGKRREGP